MTLNLLNHLHSDIYDRVRAISEDNLDWPCRRGCDGCCRRLAEIPQLTMAEWDFYCLLATGIVSLMTRDSKTLIAMKTTSDESAKV